MAGRPRHKHLPPDVEEQIKRLAHIQCTWKEISFLLDIPERTLQRQYGDLYQKGKEGGKSSLRRAMWERAINGNSIPMQIWLSKQYLGMSEKVESESKTEANVVVFETSLGSSSAREGAEASTVLPTSGTGSTPQ